MIVGRCTVELVRRWEAYVGRVREPARLRARGDRGLSGMDPRRVRLLRRGVPPRCPCPRVRCHESSHGGDPHRYPRAAADRSVCLRPPRRPLRPPPASYGEYHLLLRGRAAMRVRPELLRLPRTARALWHRNGRGVGRRSFTRHGTRIPALARHLLRLSPERLLGGVPPRCPRVLDHPSSSRLARHVLDRWRTRPPRALRPLERPRVGSLAPPPNDKPRTGVAGPGGARTTLCLLGDAHDIHDVSLPWDTGSVSRLPQIRARYDCRSRRAGRSLLQPGCHHRCDCLRTVLPTDGSPRQHAHRLRAEPPGNPAVGWGR